MSRQRLATRRAGKVALYGCVGSARAQRSLIPRLGFFVGHERQIPYDFDDLLGMVAPRPALVVAPSLDRDATPADVRLAVEQARKVYALYDASEKLEVWEPWDYNRLPGGTQQKIIDWMRTRV